MNEFLSSFDETFNAEYFKKLISDHKTFIAYNGFEPSGKIHIGQALTTTLNANKIISLGGEFIILIADVFAKLNHKLGGDDNKIHESGLKFIETFKKLGIDSRVKFMWSSEIMKNKKYWDIVFDVQNTFTVKRLMRCSQIMGRQESINLSESQLIYPALQLSDIIYLNVDVCQLGLDQRKVNMLAVEYKKKLNNNKELVILSHHMIPGLTNVKMSKSDPNSAIFMNDTFEEINDKIIKSKTEPLFDWIKYLLIPWFGSVELNGKSFNGYNFTIDEFNEIIKCEDEVKKEIIKYIYEIVKLTN